jgi:hypothetical protein
MRLRQQTNKPTFPLFYWLAYNHWRTNWTNSYQRDLKNCNILFLWILAEQGGTLDPLQLAYLPNRSTDDAISIALRPLPPGQEEHLCENAVHWLQLSIWYFIRNPIGCCKSSSYSSWCTFNTIVPSKLINKLRTLWLSDGSPPGGAPRQQHICHTDRQNRGPSDACLVRTCTPCSPHISKTKELIVDYRKRRAEQAQIHIDTAVVERVGSFKVLCVHK